MVACCVHQFFHTHCIIYMKCSNAGAAEAAEVSATSKLFAKIVCKAADISAGAAYYFKMNDG